jgi:hypothetical protein
MFAVHLAVMSPDHVAVLVTDQGAPTQLQASHPDSNEESGRGLEVVASLSSLVLTFGNPDMRSMLAVVPGAATDADKDTAARCGERETSHGR